MTNGTGTKITSPTVGLEIESAGIATVIVVLAPPGAGTAASLGMRRTFSGVRSHFTSSAHGQIAALARWARPAPRRAPRRRSVPSMQAYPNLGVMLGTVDRDGLARLEADARVAAISGAPQISLIRPERAASATLSSATTWGIEALGIPALWDQGLTGRNVRIAHLDTGADATHPALEGAIDGFAVFEPALGRQVNPAPAPYDSAEHGTHTAAIIAGRPVAAKRIGIAPGASILSGIVIEGGNTVARVLGGLDWAVGAGVRIVNLSLGFRGWWQDFIPIVAILRSRGILPIIAVGNEGPGTSRSPGNYPTVLSVGAVDDSGTVASFSGSQTFARDDDPIVPDLVAPGVNVISARPGRRYQAMDGSSMAAPHVAGLAALLWEARPTATAEEIEQAILGSCQRPKSMARDRANRGMPSGAAALALLTGVSAGARAAAAGGPTARRVVRQRPAPKAVTPRRRSR